MNTMARPISKRGTRRTIIWKTLFGPGSLSTINAFPCLLAVIDETGYDITVFWSSSCRPRRKETRRLLDIFMSALSPSRDRLFLSKFFRTGDGLFNPGALHNGGHLRGVSAFEAVRLTFLKEGTSHGHLGFDLTSRSTSARLGSVKLGCLRHLLHGDGFIFAFVINRPR